MALLADATTLEGGSSNRFSSLFANSSLITYSLNFPPTARTVFKSSAFTTAPSS